MDFLGISIVGLDLVLEGRGWREEFCLGVVRVGLWSGVVVVEK